MGNLIIGLIANLKLEAVFLYFWIIIVWTEMGWGICLVTPSPTKISADFDFEQSVRRDEERDKKHSFRIIIWIHDIISVPVKCYLL